MYVKAGLRNGVMVELGCIDYELGYVCKFLHGVSFRLSKSGKGMIVPHS